MPKLRAYQQQALFSRQAAAVHRPDENRQLIDMATGLGKTMTFAVEGGRFLRLGTGMRPMALVHTDELADQAVRKIEIMNPGRTVGLVKADRNDVEADFLVGSVPTLAAADRRRQVKHIGHLIIDEAHHAVASQYQTIMEHYGAMDGRITVTGYTATPERGDGQSLAPTWHDVAFSRGISWAVRQGFLVPPVGYRVEIPELGSVAGQSNQALDAALVDSIAPEAIVREWLKVASGRSTVLFAPLVASAEAFAAAFRAVNVSAAVVWGDMPKPDRRRILAAYERGEITVLCNAMVLTEGWDSPRTSCVIVARPTKSRPLFIQMAGRGLRPWLDGPIPREDQDCILLCVADSTTDLRTVADLSDRPGLVAEDGKSLLALEDEFDLSRDLEPDPVDAYGGAVRLEQFDPLVAQSSKVWTKTQGGALFVPAGRDAYVFLAPDTEGLAVAIVERTGGRRVHRRIPDTELAMAMAEDLAVEHGGDMGRLLADKTRAWRKGRPTADSPMLALAERMGLSAEVDKIMSSKAGGKAGKVSDLINRVKASRQIDPAVAKIRERTGRNA